MSKRRNTSSAEPESPHSNQQSSSHFGSESEDDRGEEPKLDANTGQTGAFPGLRDDDTLFYGPAKDGLDYLRMVRSEAKNIPSLLSVATNNTDHQFFQENDHEGFFDEDEAFVAGSAPDEQPMPSVSKAQQLYNDAILLRFNHLRSFLRRVPSLDHIKALPDGTPISFPLSSKVARETWEVYILNHAANPVQIASMDNESVMELLRFLIKRMRKFLRSSAENDVQRIGSWLWAVLAKCRDRGELGSEEISDLRACAKAAHETWQWLEDKTHVLARAPEQDDERSNEEDASSHSCENGQEEHANLHNLSDAGDASTLGAPHFGKRHVILDMVITIVGEAYGQRDLLELRRPWELIDQC